MANTFNEMHPRNQSRLPGMESLTELYKIGSGPSSSHTIGPERACLLFRDQYPLADTFEATLFGSLAKTGKGHGTDAIIQKSFAPHPCRIIFDAENDDIPHPNTMDLRAFQNGALVGEMRVMSVGGGRIHVAAKAAQTTVAAETKAMSSVEEPTDEVASEQLPLSEAVPADKEFISVKADYKVSLIRIADIVYIESEGEYVRIHLADGSRVTTLFRIKNMEASLPADSFMRIHRCYIVNLHRIRSYVRGRVYLNEHDYLPIGENYKESFKGYIERTYKQLKVES